MTRKFDPSEQLVVASHNEGKVREICELLKGRVANVVSSAELGLTEPPETADTFVGNAVQKAVASAKESGKICLADDSGLAVTALNGDPGVYSARWAGKPRDFSKAMKLVNYALEENQAEDRSAKFVCVLALAWPDGHTETVEGIVYGDLVWPPRGDQGFGYDAMFQPAGYDITFGEMDPEVKQSISHRADAFLRLIGKCFS